MKKSVILPVIIALVCGIFIGVLAFSGIVFPSEPDIPDNPGGDLNPPVYENSLEEVFALYNKGNYTAVFSLKEDYTSDVSSISTEVTVDGNKALIYDRLVTGERKYLELDETDNCTYIYQNNGYYWFKEKDDVEVFQLQTDLMSIKEDELYDADKYTVTERDGKEVYDMNVGHLPLGALLLSVTIEENGFSMKIVSGLGMGLAEYTGVFYDLGKSSVTLPETGDTYEEAHTNFSDFFVGLDEGNVTIKTTVYDRLNGKTVETIIKAMRTETSEIFEFNTQGTVYYIERIYTTDLWYLYLEVYGKYIKKLVDVDESEEYFVDSRLRHVNIFLYSDMYEYSYEENIFVLKDEEIPESEKYGFFDVTIKVSGATQAKISMLYDDDDVCEDITAEFYDVGTTSFELPDVD